MNIYSMIVYSSYSTPVLLLPKLATLKSISDFEVSLIFSSFPIGAFPASIIIGKLMRFYRKDRLLLLFTVVSSAARFTFGTLYFIDDNTVLVVVGFLARMTAGISEGAIIPIIYSFVPELFPKEIMEKMGILEIWGSIGVIIGSPIASILYEQIGYFFVFTIMSSFNLVVGFLIIILFLKSDMIVQFKASEKKSIPIKQALFSNKAVLLNSFYFFLFCFPYYMIQTNYESYFSTYLTDNLYLASFVYTLILFGMVIAVYFIKYFFQKQYKKKMFFISGITVIVALFFYGPDPIFNIHNTAVKITLVGAAFLFVGFAIEIIFLIATKQLILDLLVVFPNEKALCGDFSVGIYEACFALDQFLGPIIGDFLNTLLGYERTGSFYSLILIIFMIIYWGIMRNEENPYEDLVEEEEIKEQQEIKIETQVNVEK